MGFEWRCDTNWLSRVIVWGLRVDDLEKREALPTRLSEAPKSKIQGPTNEDWRGKQ